VPHESGNVSDTLENGDCRETVAGIMDYAPPLPDYITESMIPTYSDHCKAYRQTVLDRASKFKARMGSTVYDDKEVGTM
jgi:hypothetical protein